MIFINRQISMGKIDACIIPVTPFRQDCTLLFDETNRKGILIDPGGDLPHILEAVEKNGIDVEAVWLTHGHIDHAGAAMDAEDALGVDIIGPHAADRILLDRLDDTPESYNLSGLVRNCVPDLWLNDRDTVFCAGHAF